MKQTLHRNQKKNLLFYSFRNLSKDRAVVHFVTTREGGFSQAPFHTFNLASHVGDEEENVLRNRRILASSFNIPPRNFVTSKQVHGTEIAVVNRKSNEYPEDASFSILGEYDGMVTDLQEICLLIFIADCVPIFLYDRRKKVIALVHAGWKGTLGLITMKAINKMQSYFGSQAQDILCSIGPSIGPCCYQVGHEVITKVREVFPREGHILHSISNDGKGTFDLWEANKLQLLHRYIPEKNIEVACICTYCNSDLFFSSRKENGHTGRFAAGIMLTEGQKSNDS